MWRTYRATWFYNLKCYNKHIVNIMFHHIHHFIVALMCIENKTLQFLSQWDRSSWPTYLTNELWTGQYERDSGSISGGQGQGLYISLTTPMGCKKITYKIRVSFSVHIGIALRYPGNKTNQQKYILSYSYMCHPEKFKKHIFNMVQRWTESEIETSSHETCLFVN